MEQKQQIQTNKVKQLEEFFTQAPDQIQTRTLNTQTAFVAKNKKKNQVQLDDQNLNMNSTANEAQNIGQQPSIQENNSLIEQGKKKEKASEKFTKFLFQAPNQVQSKTLASTNAFVVNTKKNQNNTISNFKSDIANPVFAENLERNNSKKSLEQMVTTNSQFQQDNPNRQSIVRNKSTESNSQSEFVKNQSQQMSNKPFQGDLEIIKPEDTTHINIDHIDDKFQFEEESQLKANKGVLNKANQDKIQNAEEKRKQLQQQLKMIDQEIKVLSSSNPVVNPETLQLIEQSKQPKQNALKIRAEISEDIQAREKALEFVKQMNKERQEKKEKKKNQKDPNEMYEKFMQESIMREDEKKKKEQEIKRQKIQKNLEEIQKRKQYRELFVNASNKIITDIKVEVEKENPEKKFHEEVELPQIIQRQQELAQQRETNQIDHEEIANFSQKHDAEVRIQQIQTNYNIQRDVMGPEFNMEVDLRPYQAKQSQFTQDYLEQLKNQKQNEKKQKEELKDRILKQNQYAKLVQEVFEPKTKIRSNDAYNPPLSAQQMGFFEREPYHEPGLVVEQSQSHNNFRKQQNSESQERSRLGGHYQISTVTNSNGSLNKIQNTNSNLNSLLSNREQEYSPNKSQMPNIKNTANVNNSHIANLNTQKPLPDSIIPDYNQYLPMVPNNNNNNNISSNNNFVNYNGKNQSQNRLNTNYHPINTDDNRFQNIISQNEQRSQYPNIPKSHQSSSYHNNNPRKETASNLKMRQDSIGIYQSRDDDSRERETKQNKHDYLIDLRRQRQETEKKQGQKIKFQNWEKYKQNENLTENEKYNYILQSANRIENIAQIKEQRAHANHDPEMQEQVNNLYIDSIQAQLSILENIK